MSESSQPTLTDIAYQLGQITQQITQNNTQVNSRFDRLEERIEKIESRIELSEAKLAEEVKRWDERFFNFTKDNLGITRTIIITAGVVTIFSPFVQALAPAIKELTVRFFNLSGA
jgi:predicted PurR-regulated permease PerM